jgi:subtilisin family serine protease
VDARAAEAWVAGSSKGAGVVVAVIDSGMDIKHPLLKSQLWVNPGETSGNGKDDDGNGLPDDIYGWNFGDSNSDLTDYVSRGGHGTHVAGIIAGQTVDGFTGMAPEAKLMVLKFIDGSGRGLLGDAVAAITYARKNGAKVINASWGGSQCQDSLKLEITAAATSGVFMAVAAGNGDASGHGVDINLQPEWPANYIIPGKLTIAAHNIDQTLAVFSNYGVLVDLAAPGENIFSTLQTPSGQVEAGLMGAKSGTSMATPMVAGAAALL